MTKEEAIQYVIDAFTAWECEYDTEGADWSKEHEACDIAVNALATESIPVAFIKEQLWDWMETWHAQAYGDLLDEWEKQKETWIEATEE